MMFLFNSSGRPADYNLYIMNYDLPACWFTCVMNPLTSLYLTAQRTTTRLISVTQPLAEPPDCQFICTDTHPLNGGSVTSPPPRPLSPPQPCWLPAHPLLPHLTPLWMPVASRDRHTPVSMSSSLPVHTAATSEYDELQQRADLFLCRCVSSYSCSSSLVDMIGCFLHLLLLRGSRTPHY